MDSPITLEWLDGLAGLDWLRFDLLVRLILAAILGGVIGLEREISGKPAGLRTNLLICVGATLLTELSVAVSNLAAPGVRTADPARIAAQIVSGIGFLGAGTIIQARGSVVGLTTAATLWVVAAIGMAVGAQAYMEAVGTTILVIATLFLLGRLEARLLSGYAERRIQVVMEPEPGLVQEVESVLQKAGFTVGLLDVERGPDQLILTYEATGASSAWAVAVRRLMDLPAVRKVSLSS